MWPRTVLRFKLREREEVNLTDECNMDAAASLWHWMFRFMQSYTHPLGELWMRAVANEKVEAWTLRWLISHMICITNGARVRFFPIRHFSFRQVIALASGNFLVRVEYRYEKFSKHSRQLIPLAIQ